MASRGGQPGNQNRRKPKLISDALRREATQDPEKISKMALKILELAGNGDMTAATFVRDCLDGKPHQSIDIEHEVGDNLALMNQEELSAAVAARLAPFLPRPTVPGVGTDRADGEGGDPRTH